MRRSSVHRWVLTLASVSIFRGSGNHQVSLGPFGSEQFMKVALQEMRRWSRLLGLDCLCDGVILAAAYSNHNHDRTEGDQSCCHVIRGCHLKL